MIKTIITSAIVSKGYNSESPLKFSKDGDIVFFKIGCRVYDSRVKGNYRWINLSIKAFGKVCESIKKMKLKAGAHVNLVGRLTEETWENENNEKKKIMCIILDEMEYCSIPKNKSEKVQEQDNTEESQNFMGYESFGDNPFFEG